MRAGQWEEALEVGREAVTIRRQLAQDNPAAYLPDLATSLNNLASSSARSGQREEALEMAREAVTIRRQLAQDNPAAYLPDLAASLDNLASFLSEAGEPIRQRNCSVTSLAFFRAAQAASAISCWPEAAGERARTAWPMQSPT